MKKRKVALLMAVVTACSQVIGSAPLVMAEEAPVVAEEAAAPEEALSETLWQEPDAVPQQEAVAEAVAWQEPDAEIDELIDAEEESAGEDAAAPAGEQAESEESGNEAGALLAEELNLEGDGLLSFVEEVDTAAVDALGLGDEGEEENNGEENPVFFENLREDGWTFVFEGETCRIDLNTEALELDTDYEVNWQVGLNTEEGLIPDEQYVTYETDGSSLLLTGVKETPRTDTVGIYAEVIVEDEVQAAAGMTVDVRPQRYEYDFPGWGTQLPYWVTSIDKELHCWVENPEHPYREDVATQITDVAVSIEDGEENAVTVEPYEDGNGWNFTMNSYCYAIVTISYEPVDGDEAPGEYAFDFWVSQDEWGIDLYNNTGVSQMLPGSVMELTAEPYHNCYTEEEGHFAGDTNVDLVWRIEENEDGAFSIEQDKENPGICYVTASESAESNQTAWISVYAYLLEEDGSRAKDEEGNEIEVASDNFWVEIQEGYSNLVPTDLEKYDLAVGETVEYAPQLQNIWLDEDGTEHVELVTEDVRYRWEWDENAVKITDADGKVLAQNADVGTAPFTIEKLENWNTNIRVIAERPNEDGEYEESFSRDWWLWEVDYSTWFEGLRGRDWSWIYSDEEAELLLNTENLDKPEFSIEWTVGFTDDDGDFGDRIVGADTGAYAVNEDGLGLTLHGDVMAEIMEEHEWATMDFRAVIQAGSETVCQVDTWMQVRGAYYELEDDAQEDTLVGNGFYYDDHVVNCWVENSQYPYGETLPLTIKELISDNEEVIQAVYDEEIGRWKLEAITEGEANITYVTTSEALGDMSFERCKRVTDELYMLDVYSETGTDQLLPGASLKLHTDVLQGIYDGETGDQSWQLLTDGYTLTYSDYDTELIAVDEDGVVTALNQTGETGLTVKLEAPMKNGDTYVKYAGFMIYVSDRYDQVTAESVTAEPGETVGIAAVNPVMLGFSSETPEGSPLTSAVLKFVQEDDCLAVSEDGSSFTVAADAVGPENSPQRATVIVRGEVTEADGETRSYDYWLTIVLCSHAWDEGIVTKEATCVEAGTKTVTCERCDSTKTVEIPATGHTPVTDVAVAATCTTAGKTEGSHCLVCGAVLKAQTEIPATGHTWDGGVITKAATCTEAGVKTYTCTICHETKIETVAATGHIWSAWQRATAATVFAAETQKRTCTACGAAETRTVGTKLTPTMKLSATSVPLKVKQSTTKVKVSGLAAGDSVKSWKSSNTKIVTVNSSGKITAKSKTGTATVTVTLASGLSKKITVKVQKSAVKTTKISGLTKKLTINKGKKATLSPVITPVTSLQKVTYSSSNKKVATVSSKGVITAKKAGTAKITVKSGSKKYVVTVTVPKTATTAINKVPSAISIKKGKTYTLKASRTPSNSDYAITYTSSNKKVATVDKKGKITGKKAGTAKITVKSGTVKVTCTVTVK